MADSNSNSVSKMENDGAPIWDTLSIWHGELMPVRTTMEMLYAGESHSSEGSQLRAAIEIMHERLKRVLDKMEIMSSKLHRIDMQEENHVR